VDSLQFFSASRLVIVAGKGGVGKTTVTAVLARAAADAGLRVLVVDVEGKAGLPGLLGEPAHSTLGYEDRVLVTGLGPDGAGQVSGRSLSADQALADYLNDHGFGRVSRRLASSGVLDVVSTAAPGIEDILVLGKIKQIERSGVADLIIVDGPAAGHAITFLQAARGLLDAVKVGPIEAQARDVLELLADPDRCQVMLVALPEETPVNELIETSYSLEDRIGVALTPVVINGIYPERDLPTDPATLASLPADLRAAAEFRQARCALQREQLARLSNDLPLQQIRLPFVFTAGLSADNVIQLAVELTTSIEALP
jgi:anion-transporting  ArsA/GET3 family ATPase